MPGGRDTQTRPLPSVARVRCRRESPQPPDDEVVGRARSTLPAIRRYRHARPAAAPPSAALAVPGFRRHDARAAGRHPQPGDDRRARRPGVAGRHHGGVARGVRAVSGADRLSLRHAPLRAGLAPRAVHLERDTAPVRRLRRHAVRASWCWPGTATRRNIPTGSAPPPPAWPSCWSVRACTRRRPPASPWRPT